MLKRGAAPSRVLFQSTQLDTDLLVPSNKPSHVHWAYIHTNGTILRSDYVALVLTSEDLQHTKDCQAVHWKVLNAIYWLSQISLDTVHSGWCCVKKILWSFKSLLGKWMCRLLYSFNTHIALLSRTVCQLTKWNKTPLPARTRFFKVLLDDMVVEDLIITGPHGS